MKKKREEPKETQKLIISAYRMFTSLLKELLNALVVLFLKIKDEQANEFTINRRASKDTTSIRTINEIIDRTDVRKGTIKKKLNKRIICSDDSRAFITKKVL